MYIKKNLYIINRPQIATGGLDGFSFYDINKKQVFYGKTTWNIKKKNYDDIIIKNKLTYDNLLIYHGKYDENWRHFIRETFCNLRYFYDTKLENLKILIPEIHAKHVKEVIDIMDLNNNVIILNRYDQIFVKNIIIPDVHIDFNFVNKFIEKCKIKSTIKINNEMKNIFFSRKHLNLKRPITNYNDFHNICVKNNKNIYPIIPESYNLADQIIIINNANKIISLIGACCENIIFTNNNCKFNIICSKSTVCWANNYKTNFYNGTNKCIVLDHGILDLNYKQIDRDRNNHPWMIDINKILPYFH
jgi:hypothetical protein